MKDETWNELVRFRAEAEAHIEMMELNDRAVPAETRVLIHLVDAIMALDEDIENINTFLTR